MATTHEVTRHDDMVRVVTKVDDEVSVTRECTLHDWLDSVSPALSKHGRERCNRNGTAIMIYTEADYE